jgi:hypothetical protein
MTEKQKWLNFGEDEYGGNVGVRDGDENWILKLNNINYENLKYLLMNFFLNNLIINILNNNNNGQHRK